MSAENEMVKFVECHWLLGLDKVQSNKVVDDYFRHLRKDLSLPSEEGLMDVARYDPHLVETIERFKPPGVYVTEVPRKYAPFIEAHGSSDTEYTVLDFGRYQIDKIKALLANKHSTSAQSLLDEIEQVVNETVQEY